MREVRGAEAEGEAVNRGYAVIGLDNPKTDANVGGVLRAASCYGVAGVVLTGSRVRYATDTPKAYRHMPVFHGVADLYEHIPFDCVPVAVDLVPNAIPLPDYQHPQRAFYVFGAEDATLGERVLRWCRDRVYVPTAGCMNLAATVNVVLYDRMCKGMEARR